MSATPSPTGEQAPRLRFLWVNSPLCLAGTALTTASGIVLLTLLAMDLLGFSGGPYSGILAFLVLPAVFVLGLLLIPLGLWRRRRRIRWALAEGRALPSLVVDLGQPPTRRVLLILAAATAVNIVIIGAATYKGVEVMDSTHFCGACHRVMDPEYTAYLRSPHARVNCVECHIGSGASWFVKSKLSGSWQVIALALDLYPRPIPVPVKNLRPARDTCEHCHWPSKFVGDRLKIITRFGDDERNSETKTVLLLHVGAGGLHAGGIHAHVAQGVSVRYRSDGRREHISEVEWTAPDGKATRYRAEGAEGLAAGEWHVMDCIDCHNRPTHVFPGPEDEIDAALAGGRIDGTLPFVRREGLAAISAKYGSHEEARAAIRARLVAFYAEHHPDLARRKAPAIEAAAEELGRIYAADVWPSMNITWGTYPSFTGHQSAPGCFRCHDESHQSAQGKTISQDCTLCHNLLAVDEANPAILKQLGP